MSIEEIRTNDTDQSITVTIDNETIPINIKEIRKQSTYFVQKKTLNNVLNNPIDIKLFLAAFYNNEETTEIDENNEISNEIPTYVDELHNNVYQNYVANGIVKITIKNAQTNHIYIQDNFTLKNGFIEEQLTNNLKIGEYILTAEYEGSKYYAPTNINIYFNISKRIIKCEFQENILSGHPGETITTNIHLVDSLNGQGIPNTLLYYSFNDNEYATQTNSQGAATLYLTIPDVDPSKCSKEFANNDEIYDEENNVGEYYWDENGTLQPIIQDQHTIVNTEEVSVAEEESYQSYYTHMYPLDIYIENNTYIVENFTQYIIATKIDTNIIIYDTFEKDSKWYIRGEVIQNTDLSDVKYGKINLKLNENKYQQTVLLDSEGHFEFIVDVYNLIEATSNNISSQEPVEYSFSENTVTILEEIPNTIERSYIEKNGLDCVALVKNIATNRPVKDGMVAFIITKNNKEIYKYVSELDIEGRAYFRFDVSTLGTYNIKVHYYGIFEYQDSESDIQSYTVIEED